MDGMRHLMQLISGIGTGGGSMCTTAKAAATTTAASLNYSTSPQTSEVCPFTSNFKVTSARLS
jgi:hypothetical protein